MKQTKHIGIYLKLNEVNDSDIIKRLQEERKKGSSKQGYIKELIRTDIELDKLRNSFGNLTTVKEG